MKSKNYYRVLGHKGWYSDYLRTRRDAVRVLANRLRLNEENLRVKHEGKELDEAEMKKLFIDAYLQIAVVDAGKRLGIPPEDICSLIGHRMAETLLSETLK